MFQHCCRGSVAKVAPIFGHTFCFRRVAELWQAIGKDYKRSSWCFSDVKSRKSRVFAEKQAFVKFFQVIKGQGSIFEGIDFENLIQQGRFFLFFSKKRSTKVSLKKI